MSRNLKSGKLARTGLAVTRWWEGRRALLAGFDGNLYLLANPDVALAGIDPLRHYLKHGKKEGRRLVPEFLQERNIARSVRELLERKTALPIDEVHPDVRADAEQIVNAASSSVSVVVPTWNRAGTICNAIDSILGQSIAAAQIIISDDGSEDDTIARLNERYRQEIERGRILILENPHRGISATRNAALSAATGEIVAFLDSDNLWLRDHLLYALAALAVCGTPVVYTGLWHNDRVLGSRRILSRPFERRRLLQSNFIDMNTVVHIRNFLSQPIFFDETMNRLVDWDYVIGLTANHDAMQVPVVTIEYILDKATHNHITHSFPIEPNVEIVKQKNWREYFERGLVTRPTPPPSAIGSHGDNHDGFVVLPKPLEKPDALGALLGSLDIKVGLVVDEGDGWVRRVDSFGQKYGEPLAAGSFGREPFWVPDLDSPLPRADQLRALFVSAKSGALDIAVLSFSLETECVMVCGSLQNQMVLGPGLIEDWLCGRQLQRFVCGKMLRMPPPPADQHVRLVTLDFIVGCPISLDKKNGIFTKPGHSPDQWPGLRFQRAGIVTAPRQPAIFVFGMKLAVGGVERNIVETLRVLRDRYDFVYITLERTQPDQGSLAGQVMDVAYRLADLAETSPQSSHLADLEELRDLYNPVAIWICNGSMWLSRHAAEIRQIFHEIPIIDQQVYDTEKGWIRHYGNPGIRSFDRFIAINEKIRETFVRKHGIDPNRIDLIYHCIDERAIADFKRAPTAPQAVRAKFGLPPDTRIFAFVGRLAEQKQPLRFLELALRYQDSGTTFVIVGDGAMRAEVETWMAKHRPTSIVWIRYTAELTALFSVASGLIMTSEFEGLPIAMLEALAMGVPVLSTDVGAVAEVLAAHGAGHTVPLPFEARVFEDEFVRWTKSLDTFRSNLVSESDKVLRRFSASTIAEQYVASLERAMAERPIRKDLSMSAAG